MEKVVTSDTLQCFYRNVNVAGRKTKMENRLAQA